MGTCGGVDVAPTCTGSPLAIDLFSVDSYKRTRNSFVAKQPWDIIPLWLVSLPTP
jgi:hypothetical protein